MTSRTLRLARRLLPLAAALVAAGPLSAQGPTPLDPVVTTATRTPESIFTVGTEVDQISGADLARQQLSTVADALSLVPGAPVFGTGQSGASDSLFLRGANSNQVLFLVDGIRLNDPNTDYGPFIAGARVCGCDSIEVAHGPQSTLYGGEAIGGVVSLQSARGVGPAASDLSFEAGSFGTVQGALETQAGIGPWAYNVSLSGGKTENDRPNNAFTSANVAARIDYDLNADVSVGATLRTFIGRYDDPGDIYTNDPDDYEEEANWLGTLFANVKIAPEWTAKLTLGGQDRRFASYEATEGEPTEISVVTNRRGVIDAQTSYSGLPGQRLTLGATAEAETTTNDGFGSIDKRQSLFALFGEDEWRIADTLHLTGGLRYDDFDTFGDAVTGRLTAAWLVADKRFKIHSSYGTGFRSPAFLDLYGQSPYYVGNPNLKPEKARGWDAGVDYYFPNKAGTLSLTWFRTDYTDLIEYNFNVFPSTVVNIDRARTDGVEVSSKLNLPGGLVGNLAYTYLDAYDLTSDTRLLRRPRNSGSAGMSKDFDALTVGVGVQVVRDRVDVDALTFEDVEDPNYSVWRLYAAYKVSASLSLKARIENALDKKYAPVNGYPALPIGLFAGIDYKF